MVGKQVRRMLSKKVDNPTNQTWIENELRKNEEHKSWKF